MFSCPPISRDTWAFSGLLWSINQDKTLVDSQPGPCNPQTAGVETSQLVSAQIQEMPTVNQTMMASAFLRLSVPRTQQYTQENTSISILENQLMPSCELARSICWLYLAGSQLMEPNNAPRDFLHRFPNKSSPWHQGQSLWRQLDYDTEW